MNICNNLSVVSSCFFFLLFWRNFLWSFLYDNFIETFVEILVVSPCKCKWIFSDNSELPCILLQVSPSITLKKCTIITTRILALIPSTYHSQISPVLFIVMWLYILSYRQFCHLCSLVYLPPQSRYSTSSNISIMPHVTLT